MKLTDLSAHLGSKACLALAWLETSASLTELMFQLAPKNQLTHCLDRLGFITVTPLEKIIWSGFVLGELVWQRVISFWVSDSCWLRATVLIPQSALKTAAGISLQYCGAQSLGGVLFTDPGLSRHALGYELKERELIRHSLYTFYSEPLVISECFSPVLW